MSKRAAAWPWLALQGVVLAVLGAGAMFGPSRGGLAPPILFPSVLLIAGAIGLIMAFVAKGDMHRGLNLASAGAALAAAIGGGTLALAAPLIATGGQTLLITLYMVIDAVTRVLLGFDQRRRKTGADAWFLASGPFDILLSGLMITIGAVAPAWIVGALLGLELVADGCALVGMSLIGHKTAAT